MVKAAVCRAFGSPLEIEEVTVRPPGPGEVGVRIAACAICHSDIAFADGAWGGPLPAVYGHEAAGVVTGAGPGVDGLAAGDRVVVTLIRSCGRCARCLRGQPSLCEDLPAADASPVLAGAAGEAIHQGMRMGAFAGLVTVDASQVVPVPAWIPPEVASLLACGVLTGVGAVMNTAAVEPGATVVVLGAGGVGLNCVQGCVLAGARQIIALDRVTAKLAAARSFGATHVIDPGQADPVAAVMELTGGRGADHVLVAAGVGSLIETGACLLRRGGCLVIVGIPPAGATISLDPLAIADGSLRVLGSKMGAARPHRDIPLLAGLYAAGRLKLDELISGRFELDRINDAIDSARAGAQLRPVVVFPALSMAWMAPPGVVGVEPGQRPQRRPLKRHDSEMAQQMVERAAGLARDSHARTRHAAVLVKDHSLLAWGTNGVPFPGEDHCYCKVAEFGHHDQCRTHAEQRAIRLAREGDGWQKLPGSKLIYVRLEADDSVRLEEPHFCARCARLALSLGVREWIFALSDGLVGYSASDYDAIARLRW